VCTIAAGYYAYRIYQNEEKVNWSILKPLNVQVNMAHSLVKKIELILKDWDQDFPTIEGGTCFLHTGKKDKEGRAHGPGVGVYEDHSCYEGHYYRSKKHHKGSIKYQDGCIYTGDFWQDARHGKGKYLDPWGTVIYSGRWHEDVPIHDAREEEKDWAKYGRDHNIENTRDPDYVMHALDIADFLDAYETGNSNYLNQQRALIKNSLGEDIAQEIVLHGSEAEKSQMFDEMLNEVQDIAKEVYQDHTGDLSSKSKRAQSEDQEKHHSRHHEDNSVTFKSFHKHSRKRESDRKHKERRSAKRATTMSGSEMQAKLADGGKDDGHHSDDTDEMNII
jgi:hypothetical protein